MPTVSVIIPTYNRKALLRQALESVFAQSYRDFEVIVIDDGSTDGTEEALRPLFERIRYLSKPNGGPASARNRGIKEARGDYIAFLDSDDLWEPKFLEVTCDYLGRHDELAMVATGWRTLPEGKHRPRVAASLLHGDLFRRLIEQRFIRTSSVLARRAFMERVGGFNEGLEVAEDYDMWLRIARAYPVAFLNVPLSWGRKHSGNLSGDRLLGRLKELEVLESHYDAARVPARVFNKARSHAYISAGRCYMKLGRLGDAKACFEQALALTPYRFRPRRYLWRAKLLERVAKQKRD